MKNHKLAILIAIILFIIPFFWLKPGEMNLGGDSGRLYFYDPYTFLTNYTLYNFIGSGKGSESDAFVFTPYVFVLFLLKFIFHSPTTLIAIFNGLILSSAFLSIYFIVGELIGTKEFSKKKQLLNYSSILAGFFYVFSQELIYGGWENPIITHNQLFLNPFMFLLLLKYFLTKNNLYIVFAVFISVIFASNFSFIGAPTFFAFYPLALVFLFYYVKYIRKVSIPYKGLSFGILLFLLLHSFHLFVELLGIFSFGSAISNVVFAQEGVSSRSGLDYFIAIASNTKVSLAWMSVTQIQKDPWYAIFTVFPLTLVCGFFLNKEKTLLLTGTFFLIVLFFVSANITDVGFFIYKQLFKFIPGFSMFRNFHGQWVYVFMFFYTLLFGQAVAIVASRLKHRHAFIFMTLFCAFILFSSISFLNGSIPMLRHKDTGLRYAFQMDPTYERVLKYFKKYPVDGKIISFPFTGPGYQILQGLNGDLYQGLSMVSYLSGKSDFTGYGSLDPYHDLFLKYIKKNDSSGIKKLFSIMNIKQVFYNSDPFIYTDALKGYLYSHVSEYSPKDQDKYKAFIESLPVGNRLDFGSKYHIYSVNSDSFLPHIFSTTDLTYTNNQIYFSSDSYISGEAKTVPVSIDDSISRNNAVLYAYPWTFLSELTKNAHLHKHDPFINHSLDDIFYPFILLKEKYDLYKVRNNFNNFLNIRLFLLSKRIVEIVKLGENMPIYKASWKEPKLWEVYKWGSYNSWEASLTRYQQGMEELIEWVESSNQPNTIREASKIKINEQLFRHQIDVLRALRIMGKKNSEKKYINSLISSTFEKLFQKVKIPIYDPSKYYYDMPNYPGNYNVFLEKRESNVDLKDATIVIDNETLKPFVDVLGNIENKNLMQFANFSFKDDTETRFYLHISPDNLVESAKWDNSGSTIGTDELLTFVVNNKIGENTKGLMLNIPGWKENNAYTITFDYLTEGDDFIFSFYDKKTTIDELRKYGYKSFFEKILNAKEWKTHQSIVTAEEESSGAFLQISAFSQKNESKMYIKNLSIAKVEYPTIVFKKIDDNSQIVNRPPAIVFTKINPTKYKIEVEGAKGPYGLVLLDNFNKNWSLVDPATDEKIFMGSIFRFVGSLGRNIVGLFSNDDQKSKIVASYFDGDIKEGNHGNIFLALSTFETWGKQAIAKDKHSNTFEYANIWLINPEDMKGRSEYTLIIEMQNHKEFYIFGCISILTLIYLIAYSFKKLVLKHEKNN